MGRNLKFKVGDKVKVTATKEQLEDIGIALRHCNEDFYYIKEINPLWVDYYPYILSNGFHIPEQYLDYAD